MAAMSAFTAIRQRHARSAIRMECTMTNFDYAAELARRMQAAGHFSHAQAAQQALADIPKARAELAKQLEELHVASTWVDEDD